MTVRITGIAVWFAAAGILSVAATILFWWSPATAAEASASAVPLPLLMPEKAPNWPFLT